MLCEVLALLTGLVKHLVALIEDEVLQIGKAEVPVADESVDTAGGTDDDVGVGVLVGEKLDVCLDGCSAVEDTDPDIGEELGETVVLVSDLIGQLTSVAHNQNRGDTSLGLLVHLLQGSEDEDGCLSETGLGLAENVVTEDGLRNSNLLDCRARRHVRTDSQVVATKFAKGSVRPTCAVEVVHTRECAA
jgi:hypothetical protein